MEFKFYDEKMVYSLKVKKRIAIYSYIRPNATPAQSPAR
jgi:hypothetical protein